MAGIDEQGPVIGPNAVIQTAIALDAALGEEAARAIFAAGGLEAIYDDPPGRMVAEEIVVRLNRSIERKLGTAQARAVLAEAGRRTGAYVLENRIPSAAKALLRLLPAAFAQRLLLRAIKANAWTFAGSARIEVLPGDPARITLAGNRIASPGGVWHAAVFETLFAALVNSTTQVGRAAGPPSPDMEVFVIDWARRPQDEPAGDSVTLPDSFARP